MRVEFVHWSNVATLTGRTIELDENCGVICPVYYLVSASSWSGCEVVHPATGVQIRKVKKADRPRVPPSIVRLMQIYRTAIEGAQGHTISRLAFDDSPLAECAVCHTADSAFQCVCCLMHWHTQCAGFVCDALLGTSQVHLHDLQWGMIPRIVIADKPIAEWPSIREDGTRVLLVKAWQVSIEFELIGRVRSRVCACSR